MAVIGGFALLTVVMTWPQVRHLNTMVPNSDDPLLSIWRLSWIAHVLPSHPADLLNGNIFYPEKRTLAYTDAALLEGLVASPFIWAGISPIATYNLLVLACMALSGAAMWAYCRRLTGSDRAAWLGGIVFAFVPFRFDHFQHLELQATMFLPLALLSVEHVLESGRVRDWVGLGASVVAQVYAGIYYGVFLLTALAVVVPVRVWLLPAERRARQVRPALLLALAVGAVTAPYLAAYVQNRDLLGERSLSDIHLYSATWWNYLATGSGNVLYGGWSFGLGQNERRLFPGALALALSAVGVTRLTRQRATLLAVGVVGLIISLGVTTPLYDLLRAVAFPYRGLRAPARASILVFLAVGGLAAVGWSRIEETLPRWARRAAVAVGAAMLLEYATVIGPWLTLPSPPPAVYRWLAAEPRSVVVEFPLPTADRLDFLYEGLYMLGSTVHRQPLLNGYSGFFPRSFFELLERTATFPDDGSLGYLRERGVNLIIVHGGDMSADRFGAMSAALAARTDVAPAARFEEARGPDMVFRLVERSADGR
jgi:hypothetical protein